MILLIFPQYYRKMDSQSSFSDDDSNNSSLDTKYKTLFYFQEYLTNEFQKLNQWNSNVSLSTFQYLRTEAPILKKQATLINSGFQVRIVAFCDRIATCFQQINQKYSNLFKHQQTDQKELGATDKALYQLVGYLQLAQINSWFKFYGNLFEQKLSQTYKHLRQSLLYCIDLQTLWLTLITPKMFRKQQNMSIYKYSLCGNPNFYQKQITLAKRKYLAHSHCFDVPNSQLELMEKMKEIINDQKIKDSNQMKALFLIKGQYYNKNDPVSLKQNFIRESLRVYNHIAFSESWDFEKYQKLCYKVLQQSQNDPDLLLCLLFMEPEEIQFSNRKLFLQFAQIFNNILSQMLQILDGTTNEQINYPFLSAILDDYNIQLFICLLINFQSSCKEIFSIDNPELHQLFLEILEKMKNLYLSFMNNTWIWPPSIIQSIRIQFFLRLSQNFTTEILVGVPGMINHLNQQILPQLLVIDKSADNQFSLKKKKISKQDYLSIIFAYLDDYLTKFPEEYIDLPEVYPVDFCTSVLCVRALQLKLKHHSPPNQQTKKTYCQLLDSCYQTHKVSNHFTWYKNNEQMCNVGERQSEFAFQKSINEKWARQLFQNLLNMRDIEKNQNFIRAFWNHELELINKVISYLKFCLGMNFSASRYSENLQDTEILFFILQEIQMHLNISYDNIFQVSQDDEISLNYLHLCLMFYNTSIKQAQGSQVYNLIVVKIIIPWIHSCSKQATKFKIQFKQFFQPFILNGEQFLVVGDELVSMIAGHQSNKKDEGYILEKLNYFMTLTGSTNKGQKQELLGKVISIMHSQFNVQLFIPISELIVELQISNDYSLLSSLNFPLQDQKLSKLLPKISASKQRVKNPLRRQLSNKFTEAALSLSLQSNFNLFNIRYDYLKSLSNQNELVQNCVKGLKQFPQIPQEKPELYLIKGALCFIVIWKKVEAANKQEIYKLVEQVINAIEKLMQHWKPKQKVSLLNLLPTDLSSQIKKQYLSIKDPLKGKDKEDMTEKLMIRFVKVWCESVVVKAGNLEDVISFEQDFLDYIKQMSNNDGTALGIQIIKQNKIKYKHFKKIIKKLPALEKYAEETIQSIGDPTPELICKLILINSKYHSEKIEAYILEKLSIFNGLIPVKIHEKYLVKQIKKQLTEIPENFLFKIFYEHQDGNDNHLIIQKLNEVFYKLLCLPIKRFQNPTIKQQEKKDALESKKENEDEQWCTQSENQSCFGSSDHQQLQNKADNSSMSKSSKNSSDSACEDDEDDDNSEEPYDESDKPEIAEMFYNENDQNLPKYKQYVVVREEIDVMVNSNYEQKHLAGFMDHPEYKEKLQKIIKALESISSDSIISEINLKMPKSLFLQMKSLNYSKNINEQEWLKQLKEQKKLPSFEDQNGYVSDFDYEVDDSEMDDSEQDFSEEISLSVSRKGYSSIDSQSEVDETNIDQYLQDEKYIIELPDLKEVNSKIQTELTGNQFQTEELYKILEIAIFKLFTFTHSQRSLVAVISFYKEIFESQFIKIFTDTVLTICRIDESYDRMKKYQLSKNLNEMGMSIKKGIDSFVSLIADTNMADKVEKQLISKCQQLLPIGTSVILKSDLKLRDNVMSLFILLTKIKQTTTHQKLKTLIHSLNETQKIKLTKTNAKTLTKFIYQNNSSLAIWRFIEDELLIPNLDEDLQLSCCVSIYGRMLRQQLETAFDVDKLHLSQQNLPYRYKQKVAQNFLRVFNKKIKLYCSWSKKCLSGVDHDKLKRYLGNQDLILLTEFIVYYIRAMKIKFHSDSNEKTFKKIIKLPEMLIKISFIYMYFCREKLKTNKWESLSTVQSFFKAYNYSKYKFTRMEQVCNLIVELSNIQIFCGPKYKEIFLPFLIKNPQNSKDLPLMFKAPRVPEEAQGRRIYVTRECSFDMALYQLKGKDLLVEFHEEQGSDYGGMVRQLLMGWKGVGIGEQGFFLGKILGVSFKNSIPYGGQFDLGMAIALTNYQVNLQFMKKYEKPVYDSLMFIKENDPEDLQFKFIITKEKYGIIRQYTLKEKGEETEVTEENKQEYIDLYLEKYYSIGRQWELTQIRNGFYTVVYQKYAEIFNPIEMIQKVRGQQVTDYKKLKAKAKYEEGYTQNSPIIKWLWEIISKFTQEQMNKFMQFLTGAPKVSLYDPYFTFTVEKTYEQDEKRLPVAHTCFSTLDLPEYSSKQILEAKLKQAIFEGNDNFGIL